MAPPSRSPHSKGGSQWERQNPMRWQPWIEPISQIWTTNRHGFALSGLGSSTILQDPPLSHIMQVMRRLGWETRIAFRLSKEFLQKRKKSKRKYSYGKQLENVKVRPLPKYHSEEGGREQGAERNDCSRVEMKVQAIVRLREH